MKVKLSALIAERRALGKQLDDAGGRGVELANEIDALDKRIARLKRQRAERLAREVARCDGTGTSEFCETCGAKAARIVALLSSI